jgi:hypothetical protein
MNIAHELKALAELKDSGVLSQEEFDQQKAKLLNQNVGSSPASGGHTSNSTQGGPSEVLGYVMLGIPVFGLALIWLWVGNMTILNDPGTALSTIAIIVVIGTAIIAAVEASNLKMGSFEDLKPNGKKRDGPIAWALSLSLLWFVTYPMYMNRRAVYGVKKHLVPSLLIMILFTGSFFLMFGAIEDKKKQIRNAFQGYDSSYQSRY